MMTILPITCRVVLAFAAALGTCIAAYADDGSRGSRRPLLPKYQQECASCHIAYPPEMLPATSWQRLMTGLPRHFGVDASLDAASMKELSSWLVTNAGTYHRVRQSPPEDRITRSAWFTRKHDEVLPAAWRRPSVKSPSNCSACHAQADQGDFDERLVRIPR
jgi:hypothetical protein